MEEYKAKVIWEYGRCKGQLLVDISEQAKLLGQPHKWMAFDLEYKEPFTENPFLVISRECGEWIPCSERLPNTNGIYIVTRIIEAHFIVDASYFDGSNTWYADNRINHSRDYLKDVYAWMPLPTPYKEGDPE